jgi:acyl carrier protein
VNDADLERLVRDALHEVAPDVDPASLDAEADFHDDLGLDSMDALNLAIALQERTGVEVPELDYPRITSVSTTVAYLRDHGA